MTADYPVVNEQARTLSVKAGGVCLLIGSLAFATARLLHGDTPAADADAALTFVVERSGYAAVHIVAVLAAATIAIGITALASSLTRPAAWATQPSPPRLADRKCDRPGHVRPR